MRRTAPTMWSVFPASLSCWPSATTAAAWTRATLDHVFEPFFTTKEVGQGTGLGLATVYGIVKQNNGFINVYSEPEKGTTFRIYLPRHAGGADRTEARGGTEMPSGHGETVLMVEDDLSILDLARRMLEEQGYAVLDAPTPSRALELAERHADRIHLLLTDVVMPEMNGRDLADRLQASYPDLKVLFMSGYTANVIAHHGVLEPGRAFSCRSRLGSRTWRTRYAKPSAKKIRKRSLCSPAARRRALILPQAQQPADALGSQGLQPGEEFRLERAALGGALHFYPAAVRGHDKVGIHLGGGILTVRQVEQHRPHRPPRR